MIFIVAGILSLALPWIFTAPVFVTPLYHSKAIIHPAPNSMFFTRDPLEQLLQILKSAEVRGKIVRKFDLEKHYGIQLTNEKNRKAFRKLFRNRVYAERTQFSSVAINVYDPNPKLAAKMANDLAHLTNEKLKELRHAKFLNRAKFYRQEYLKGKKEVNRLIDSINAIRNTVDLYNPGNQADRVAQLTLNLKSRLQFQEAKLQSLLDERKNKYAFSRMIDTMIVATKSRVSGFRSSLNQIEPTAERLFQVKETLITLKKQLEMLRGRYVRYNKLYKDALFEANLELNFSFILSEARTPIEPEKPRRWLILIISFLASMFLLTAILTGWESLKPMRNKEN